MGQHSSADQWAAWIAEQQASELTVVEFCEWIGVSPNSFYRWRRKLAAKGRPMTSKGHAAEGLSVSRSPELVPLTVLASSVVEIELPCGAVVRVPNEERSLCRVLGILLEAQQTTEGSPMTTRWLDHHAGGQR